MIIIKASWAISVYFAYQRTWKPFNPILGETYEMTNHGGITFLAEQVFSLMQHALHYFLFFPLSVHLSLEYRVLKDLEIKISSHFFLLWIFLSLSFSLCI